MWLLYARAPAPDALYWPGRRWLAAVDAVAWPLAWVIVFSHAPKPVGLVGPFVVAIAFLCALGRLHRALFANHRYRFTTWRWGRVAAPLTFIGLVIRLMLTA